MWQERHRWRQRMRICFFVLALSTLFIGWWRYESDSDSMPALFSPFDALLGETPQPNPRPAPSTAVAGPNSRNIGPAPEEPAGVGTGGRGSSGNPNYRQVPSAGGSPSSSPVGSGVRRIPQGSAVVEPDESAAQKDSQRAPSAPCDPSQKTAPGSTDAPQPAQAGAPPPCNEESTERTGDTAEPRSQVR
jgi:hypothetical protein